jgi:hypothetical protein
MLLRMLEKMLYKDKEQYFNNIDRQLWTIYLLRFLLRVVLN